MSGSLALFDLDNTLLGGDSDHAWGEFLIAEGLVEASTHQLANDQFYKQYQAGTLDIHDYVRFTIGPVLHFSMAELALLHARFMDGFVKPMVLVKARELVAKHKDQGDQCIIMTATNAFITAPIAAEFGIEVLLATDLAIENGHYTGEIAGIPCFQSGKVDRLNAWLAQQESAFTMDRSCFYTDSINDLPLLEKAGRAIAVDPDPKLKQVSQDQGWEIISLR